MAVMPKGADTEEPDAGHGEEQAAAEPHSDIVARLLEYQRRLREETGGEPAPFKEREASSPPIEDERVPSVQSDTPEERSEPEVHPAEQEPATPELAEPELAEPELAEPELAEPEPAPRVPAEASSEPPDARQLKERIDRLDETLARISAMLPLLKGETKRDPDP